MHARFADQGGILPLFKAPSRRSGLLARLRRHVSRLSGALAEARERRAVLHELNMLSDRDLADIGLSRADLGCVFDPEFAASRADRGNVRDCLNQGAV
jgi:uncharacterized protein YjiS (DUF1127 family)